MRVKARHTGHASFAISDRLEPKPTKKTCGRKTVKKLKGIKGEEDENEEHVCKTGGYDL